MRPAKSAGSEPVDLLAAQPLWAQFLREGEEIRGRAGRVAAQGAEFARARAQAQQEHDDAVRRALASGELIPQFVPLDGRHIDTGQAFVEVERQAHERRREEVIRSVAPAVRRALRERIAGQMDELRPVAERLEQLAADVRASLRLEADLLASLDVGMRQRPSRSSRVRADITAAELLDAARAGRDVVELVPIDVVQAGGAVRRLGFAGGERVTEEDEAAAARSREMRQSGVIEPRSVRR